MRQGIPSEEQVAEAVRRTLRKKPRIESQREFSSLVAEDLRLSDPHMHIKGERIRRIAVSSGAAKVEIEYRESARNSLPDICPVCGNSMSRVMNSTLDGGLTEFERSCIVCPYTAGQKCRSPGRYVFLKAPECNTSEDELRIRDLKKAASHLRAAKKLIAGALKGTTFPDRKDLSEKHIDTVLSSKDEAGSIPNLIADIRNANREDPLWTEAFGTPKYPHRKII